MITKQQMDQWEAEVSDLKRALMEAEGERDALRRENEVLRIAWETVRQLDKAEHAYHFVGSNYAKRVLAEADMAREGK